MAGREAAEEGGLELLVLDGELFERRPLKPRELVLGRGENADLRIDARSVSRRHARLRPGLPWTIEDLGSSNGTTVRGRRIERGERAAIGGGDLISFGDVTLLVRARDWAQTEAMPASSMAAVWQLVDLVARTPLSVLVLGEAGVGKEVIARALHERSARSAGPLLHLDVASCSARALDRALFGHEKGAFFGAGSAKAGLLEEARGGTLFLDEISVLPASLQPKLEAALAIGAACRIGGTLPRPIDVRIVTASNRDPAELVASGTLSPELVERLGGVTIHVPPLRARRGEIAALADAFLRRAAAAANVRPPTIATNAVRKLVSHDWPGNVRELRRVVERAFTAAAGATIDVKHFALGGTGTRARRP